VTTAIVSLAAVFIVLLNFYLLYQIFLGR